MPFEYHAVIFGIKTWNLSCYPLIWPCTVTSLLPSWYDLRMHGHVWALRRHPSFLFQFILFSLSFDLRLSSSFSLVSLHIWSDHARQQQQQTHETLLFPLQAQRKRRYSWWIPRAWERNEQVSHYIENLKWVMLSTTFAVVVQHW